MLYALNQEIPGAGVDNVSNTLNEMRFHCESKELQKWELHHFQSLNNRVWTSGKR